MREQIIDYNRAYKSLKTIQEICKRYGSACHLCPFSQEEKDICCITNSAPSEWKIKKPDNKLME